MEILKAFQKNLFIKNTFLFIIGILGILISLPNPVFSFPLLIFISFIPLFILNQNFLGWRLFLLNYTFWIIILIGISFPLDFLDLKIYFLDIVYFFSIFIIISFIISFFFSLSFFIGRKYSKK